MGLVRRGEEEICKRYRPQRFSEVVGNKNTIKSLQKAMEMGEKRPKVILLFGSRGCGKTTIARILANGLNCKTTDTVEPCLECDNCKASLLGKAMHITELNLAQLNKKEDADAIIGDMGMTCLTGRNKIYIFDEAQMLTTAAQNSLLKNLEEPPKNTYVFLCTTEYKKLLPTLVDRCEKYEFKEPAKEDISEMLRSVFEQEGWMMAKEDGAKFLDTVRGMSFRAILKAMDQVQRGGLGVLSNVSEERIEYIDICRLLMKGDFKAITDKIKATENLECEALRLCILGYMKSVLISKGLSREGATICDVMEFFTTPFYEAKPEPRMVMCLFKGCVLMSGK